MAHIMRTIYLYRQQDIIRVVGLYFMRVVFIENMHVTVFKGIACGRVGNIHGAVEDTDYFYGIVMEMKRVILHAFHFCFYSCTCLISYLFYVLHFLSSDRQWIILN